MRDFFKEYWFGCFLFPIIGFVIYAIYVDHNATRTEGCSYFDTICVKSHIETSERYYGKRWNTIETEVCDEYEEVEVPCDCVTHHWFWGDSKNY